MYTGESEANVHMSVAAMIEFAEKHGGRLPAYGVVADADAVVAIAKDIQTRNTGIAAEEEAARAAAPKPAEAPEDPLNEVHKSLPPPPPPAPFTVMDIDATAEFVHRAALTVRAELQPMACVLGAVACQEIVKITGKCMPIQQFVHFSNKRALPDEFTGADFADLDGSGRYDDLKRLYGKKFVDELGDLKMFMVGCGALGCEDMKNFALCGICCGPNGMLTVTDNDRIEVSNLNRQFLFREDNIGKPKSTAAGMRVKTMNKDIKVDARQEFVGEVTEHVFHDDFWEGLDVVCNALDNIPARLYVDEKCALFGKCLMDAGTRGTSGNVDIIVPRVTRTYGEGGAADETGGIPMCTLRNFPYIFDHCVEWARAQFNDLFVQPILMSQQLRESPEKFKEKLLADYDKAEQKRSFLSKALKELESLKKTCAALEKCSKGMTMADCVELAWNDMHALFRDKINSLTKAFPKDATKKNGDKFWSETRKYPTPLQAAWAAEIEEYLISAANLYACMYGLHGEKPPPVLNDPTNRWKAEFRAATWLNGVTAKLAAPAENLSAIDDLDEELAPTSAAGGAAAAEETEESLAEKYKALADQVVALGTALKESKATPLDFEKDDDDNFHIDFVAAAAGLRARNYDIGVKDKLQVKLVAGRIIPAIATTTAAVTGLTLLEYFKVRLGRKCEDLQNGMIDLGGNVWTMMQPLEPSEIKSHVEKTYDPETDYTEERNLVMWPNPHTKYDRIIVEVDASTTVKQFCEALQAQSEGAGDTAPYEVVMVGVGKGNLWNGLPSAASYTKPILGLIADAVAPAGKAATFWEHRRLFPCLSVNLEDSNGDEVVPACICLRIKK